MKKIIILCMCYVTLYGSDIVIDRETNLIWQDDYNSKSMKKNWEEAKKYCQELVLDDKSNWRLPSIGELQSIVDENKHPGIKKTFRNIVPKTYWTDTPFISNPKEKWCVDFTYGSTNSCFIGNSYNFRCVTKL